MVKTTHRRTSKRRPRKTAKKRIRKTKSSYKKNKQSGGGRLEALYTKFKKTPIFQSLENFPNLKQMKDLIQLLKENRVDALADELLKIRPKSSLSSESQGREDEDLKSEVIRFINHVKSLRTAEILKILSKYFPRIKELRGKQSSSRRSTKRSRISGGGIDPVAAFWIIIFVICFIYAYIDDRRYRRRHEEYIEDRGGWSDYRNSGERIVTTGDTLDSAAALAATQSPRQDSFFSVMDPLINEDSEIDSYIEVIEKQDDSDQESGNECIICLDKLFPTTDIVVKLKSCGHKFHKECITRWLKGQKTCPTCRAVPEANLQGDIPGTVPSSQP